MVTALTSDLPKKLKLICACAIPLAMVAEVMTISRAGVTIMSLFLFGSTISTIKFRITPRPIAGALLVMLGFGGPACYAGKTLLELFG